MAYFGELKVQITTDFFNSEKYPKTKVQILHNTVFVLFYLSHFSSKTN
jgi:hypothetical protein